MCVTTVSLRRYRKLNCSVCCVDSFLFVVSLITENDRNLLIKSAIRRAESTGAKCTPKEIAEMLTTQPSDADSLGDEEMSGTDDLPLRDLKVEHVKCGKSEIGEVTMADFSSDEESSDDTLPVLTGTAGRSTRPSAAKGMVGVVNKVTSSSKKWIHSKKKKPRKKKRDGPIEKPSDSETWDNFFKTNRSTKARKKKRNIKTIEQVRQEAEDERIRMQSAAYYELNRPTKEWVHNSHLLDTDYDSDDDAYGTYRVDLNNI